MLTGCLYALDLNTRANVHGAGMSAGATQGAWGKARCPACVIRRGGKLPNGDRDSKAKVRPDPNPIGHRTKRRVLTPLTNDATKEMGHIMEPLRPYSWSPICDLPAGWEQSLTDRRTEALVKTWQDQAVELRKRDLYKQFLERLMRQWAIETGIIEGLYTLNEGTTLELIEIGFDASIVSHDDTNLSPADTIDKIKDQYNAIQGLYAFVAGERPLGTSYIKELHRVLTAHQDTYQARDTLGNSVIRDLPKGEWKRLPNNVEHPDGTRFEFCPPEHVAQEMDNLLAMHARHEIEAVPANVEAAWLHHRFALIHPFTDGNGRVARCLATLMLLKAHWLPLVITRDDRTAYISALRSADSGVLKPLVEIFDSLQRKAIREALSIGDEVEREATAVEGILASVRQKFERRNEELDTLVARSFELADGLLEWAIGRLKEVADEVHATVNVQDDHYRAFAAHGRRGDEKAKYNYNQIVKCAKSMGYYANWRLYQAWTALVIETDERAEILFAFHGIGHVASGVLGCAAMFYTKQPAESGERLVDQVAPLTKEPFEFTFADDPDDVRKQFRRWLDRCILAGLEHWQRTV